MPWILRITDTVLEQDRGNYNNHLGAAINAWRGMRDQLRGMTYLGSAKSLPPDANPPPAIYPYEYVHLMEFASLGQFELPWDRTLDREAVQAGSQGSPLCQEIESAYHDQDFTESRWEFMEIVGPPRDVLTDGRHDRLLRITETVPIAPNTRRAAQSAHRIAQVIAAYRRLLPEMVYLGSARVAFGRECDRLVHLIECEGREAWPNWPAVPPLYDPADRALMELVGPGRDPLEER